MKTTEKPVNLLKPYAKNQKKHDQNQIDNVAESINQFGFVQPIVIDRNNVVVIGHCRLLAAKKLKMTTVPCVIVDDLTEEQARKLRIIDNKSNESPWDMGFLMDDLAEIDFSDFDFDFPDLTECGSSTESDITEYDRRMQDFRARMDAGELSEDDEEYQEFVKKFELKKTTDDCYTPPLVYDAVANYVADKYGLDKNNFVRPFAPQGDYQAEDYKDNDVVVDNPPFSILSEILKFYNEKGIRYFLFAPHLTVLHYAQYACAVVCGSGVIYDNGARVNTSFVTNLDTCAFMSCPKLYRAIKIATEETAKERAKELPKYKYPLNVVLGTGIEKYSKFGIDFCVSREESYFIGSLDAQEEFGKSIYGGGFLISDEKKAEREVAEREKAEREKAEREKAEREKAEREKAIIWDLSEREIDIIKSISHRS